VARVPAYSPYAVAEHTLALVLSLNRRIHRAYNRVRDGNFSIEGLLGFDLHGKTVGVVGTGKHRHGAGLDPARLRLHRARVRPLSRTPPAEASARYVPIDELFARSDIVSLHCPLTPETHHLIDDEAWRR
jgi:D-lactate dehydrogenase